MAGGKLIPQPHGGALKRGNPPPKGGWPGAGKVSSKVREKCRQQFERSIDVLGDIAMGKSGSEGNPCPTPGEQVRAADTLAKYGLGEAKCIISREMAEVAVEVLVKYVAPDDYEAAVDELIEKLSDLG